MQTSFSFAIIPFLIYLRSRYLIWNNFGIRLQHYYHSDVCMIIWYNVWLRNWFILKYAYWWYKIKNVYNTNIFLRYLDYQYLLPIPFLGKWTRRQIAFLISVSVAQCLRQCSISRCAEKLVKMYLAVCSYRNDVFEISEKSKPDSKFRKEWYNIRFYIITKNDYCKALKTLWINNRGWSGIKLYNRRELINMMNHTNCLAWGF